MLTFLNYQFHNSLITITKFISSFPLLTT